MPFNAREQKKFFFVSFNRFIEFENRSNNLSPFLEKFLQYEQDCVSSIQVDYLPSTSFSRLTKKDVCHVAYCLHSFSFSYSSFFLNDTGIFCCGNGNTSYVIQIHFLSLSPLYRFLDANRFPFQCSKHIPLSSPL